MRGEGAQLIYSYDLIQRDKWPLGCNSSRQERGFCSSQETAREVWVIARSWAVAGNMLCLHSTFQRVRCSGLPQQCRRSAAHSARLGTLPKHLLFVQTHRLPPPKRMTPKLRLRKREGPAAWKRSLAMPGKVEEAMGLFSLVTLHRLEIMLSKRGIF